MIPAEFGAGGETNIHPAIFVVLLLGSILMLAVPRKYVLIPLLLLSFLIPLGQMVVIGPFHFIIYRIVLVSAWIRLLWQKYLEKSSSSTIRFTSVDKAVILYAITCLVCFTLLWQQSGALIAQLGKVYNIIGFYFVFRFFIRNERDIDCVLKAMVVVALIIAACMFNEQVSGRNVLAVLGGVPEHTAIREGYLRSQGPFRVYLTAGAFGATLIPLFLCLWRKGGSRLFATLGILAALTITITSRTSTAILACLATVIGLGMWPARNKMRAIRWGLAATLVGLHLVMRASVWALIARIDLVGGSTGWHRYKIIDNFLSHFFDWWLLGARDYMTWEGGDSMWDQANQYVAIGETTGLLSLVLFIAMIVYCFKYLGRARKAAGGDARTAWFLWLLGVALFSNLIAFVGISYFDQTFLYWYLVLAIIVAAAAPGRSVRRVSTISKSSLPEPAGWQVHARPDQPEPALRKTSLISPEV